MNSALPRHLAVSVALLTAAMLLVELIVTRLFSVLFFYHYSFFAVSLVMSGLTFGGLIASRWNMRAASEADFNERLATLAILFSLLTLAAVLVLVSFPPIARLETPATGTVALLALIFVPGLTAAGAYLAAVFARNEAWISRLYAADLAAAGTACLGAIFLLRTVQGPASLLVATLLAALAAFTLLPKRGTNRLSALLLAALSAAGIIGNIASDGRFLSLPLTEKPVLEKWNEHSRILVLNGGVEKSWHWFVIDKTAATGLPRVRPRPAGGPIPVDDWWAKDVNNIGYRLGRQLKRTAVIGVGGGRDLLAALGNGAEHVDGYELNGILVDLLKHEYASINAAATWPEVSLVHSEARVGIAHSGHRYDVIQASLIDTWAATAGGGFVLSESGLYTVEGWRTFLHALTDTGILTMTRFYLPATPAETERLVSLAAESLAQEGIAEPASHIMLATAGTLEQMQQSKYVHVTILVSKTPFTPAEVSRIAAICASEGYSMLVAPGMTSRDPVISRLLDPAARVAAIAESPYDISPPSDVRPYFFLQVRPRDVLTLVSERSGYVLEITFKAVRVMMFLGGVSVLFAILVLVTGAVTVPSPTSTMSDRRIYRWMSVYFLAIGFGYILIQLGLHQRLILILGHPTLALSVVLASMLLGSGAGSFVSGRLFPDGTFLTAWLAILFVLAILVVVVPPMSALGSIASPAGRAIAAGLITGSVGFVLGFAFPLGVRLVGPTGERAVQKVWAVNGAASIAGSAAAAMIGVGFGCRAVLVTGLLFYVVVAFCGYRAMRIAMGGGGAGGRLSTVPRDPGNVAAPA